MFLSVIYNLSTLAINGSEGSSEDESTYSPLVGVGARDIRDIESYLHLYGKMTKKREKEETDKKFNSSSSSKHQSKKVHEKRNQVKNSKFKIFKQPQPKSKTFFDDVDSKPSNQIRNEVRMYKNPFCRSIEICYIKEGKKRSSKVGISRVENTLTFGNEEYIKNNEKESEVVSDSEEEKVDTNTPHQSKDGSYINFGFENSSEGEDTVVGGTESETEPLLG